MPAALGRYERRVRKADITADVVASLVASQLPQWAELEVRPVALDGWDNTTFRLGDDLAVRLPSHERYVPQVDKEHRWLPELAEQLPFPIPQPVERGEPGCGFPRPWSVYRWLPGEPATSDRIGDLERLAADLGRFLVALQAVRSAGGPPTGQHSCDRGGPVSAWDDQVRATIPQVAGEIDAAGALAVWDAALAAAWTGPDVWVHGDVTGANLLVRDGRLAAVIDFGCSAVGDPACDLTPAWTLFDGPSRERFRAVVDADPGTWARARGWALWKALIALPLPAGHPARTGVQAGWRWDAARVVEEVLAEVR